MQNIEFELSFPPKTSISLRFYGQREVWKSISAVESFHSGFLVPEWIIAIGQAPSEKYPWESQSSQPPIFKNFSIRLIDFELQRIITMNS